MYIWAIQWGDVRDITEFFQLCGHQKGHRYIVDCYWKHWTTNTDIKYHIQTQVSILIGYGGFFLDGGYSGHVGAICGPYYFKKKYQCLIKIYLM